MYPNLRWLPIVVSGSSWSGPLPWPSNPRRSGETCIPARTPSDSGPHGNATTAGATTSCSMTRPDYADAKAPRPILVNIWYPAKLADRATPMLHRDYLAIGSDDPQLSRFAAKLVDYERDVVCKEMMGKKPAELSGEGAPAAR